MSLLQAMETTAALMGKRIVSQQLTTCTIEADGNAITLGLVDEGGETVTLRLPARQAEAISMTLPHLLSCALKMKSKDQDARYVYHLGKWTLSHSKDDDLLVFTLSTPDGFQTSFALSRDAAQRISYALREAQPATSSQEIRPIRLN
jgi:hypothetical protein